MLTDNEVSKLIDPICTIYQQIEYDLIVDIANRLADYNNIDGVLQYRLKKLQEFQKLTPELLKIFAKYSGKSENEIKKLINEAMGLNIDLSQLTKAYERDIIKVDPVVAMQSPILREIADLSYKELTKTFSLIQTKALESAKQAYINTLNTAYVEVASGNYSLQESLKKGLQRMARRGITGATYKRKNANGSYTYIEYSIEGVIRRDTVTAVHQLANKSSMELTKEIGADYVEISSHLGARTHPTNPIANHAGWQGGIYKIEGSDDKYRNLQEATGYPDDIQGLGGVNCRHRMFAFIPGISKPNPIKYCDTEENERIYKATQEQRLKERQIRKLKKEIAAIKPLGDKDVTKALQIKLKNRQAELQTHCDKYGLKRDYSRELVQEQVAKPPLTKSAKNGNINNTTQTKIVSGQSTSPMDETLYNKMKKGLEKNGIIVMEAKGDDLKFLNALGAEASYSNGYIMHIGKIPSASAMFEETIHAQQAKTYGELNTSMPTELYAREIAANRMLKRNHKAYGFTNDDLNEITANLTLWEKRFEKEVGVKYDESEYHRGI